MFQGSIILEETTVAISTDSLDCLQVWLLLQLFFHGLARALGHGIVLRAVLAINHKSVEVLRSHIILLVNLITG